MKKKIFLSLQERKNLFDTLSKGQAGGIKGGQKPPPEQTIKPTYNIPIPPPIGSIVVGIPIRW